MDQNNETESIVFDSEESSRSAQTSQEQIPGLVRLVISYSGGLLKNERQANYVLLILAGVLIIISLFLVFGEVGNSERNTTNSVTGRATIPGQVPGGI